jgi:hypothetical protein
MCDLFRHVRYSRKFGNKGIRVILFQIILHLVLVFVHPSQSDLSRGRGTTLSVTRH